jgi:hypothetical protein
MGEGAGSQHLAMIAEKAAAATNKRVKKIN